MPAFGPRPPLGGAPAHASRLAKRLGQVPLFNALHLPLEDETFVREFDAFLFRRSKPGYRFRQMFKANQSISFTADRDGVLDGVFQLPHVPGPVPGAERLAHELGARSAAVARALAAEVGDPTLRGLRRFLAAASTGEQRIRTALENAEWVEGALPIFAQSALAEITGAFTADDLLGEIFSRFCIGK